MIVSAILLLLIGPGGIPLSTHIRQFLTHAELITQNPIPFPFFATSL